ERWPAQHPHRPRPGVRGLRGPWRREHGRLHRRAPLHGHPRRPHLHRRAPVPRAPARALHAQRPLARHPLRRDRRRGLRDGRARPPLGHGSGHAPLGRGDRRGVVRARARVAAVPVAGV
ncbi:MAG: hypothetical protein AVDCRST_MAG45-1882, partial [uncultured Solirubrobacterales bacterium]